MNYVRHVLAIPSPAPCLECLPYGEMVRYFYRVRRMGLHHRRMIPSLKARRSKEVWVGIDPGFSGAIGAINERGEYLWVLDAPITALGRSGEFDVETLCEIVCEIARSPNPRVLLEWPTTRPGESPESSKRFGVGLGLLEGMFTFAGVRPARIAPNKWKGRLGLRGKDADPDAAKRAAVTLALSVISGCSHSVLHGPRGGIRDGRAEALLIAWEGLTGTRTGLAALPYELRMARVMFGGGARRKRLGGPI